MCGIFAFLGDSKSIISDEKLIKLSAKIKHRGPDNTVNERISKDIFFSFHRLRINDTSNRGDQPIYHPKDRNIVLMCNGEIYNSTKLVKDNLFETYSTSDCEVIVHLYLKYGIKKTIKLLDGVFSFILHDKTKNKTYAARDPFGIRPLFIYNYHNNYILASEIKAILGLGIPFPPGCYWDLDNPDKYERYYDYEYKINKDIHEKELRTAFINAVDKRLMSNRPIGCLLSGGLDSSLVAALVAKRISNVHTFSIGMEGSTDLHYAKIAAKYIKSTHHHVTFTVEEGLSAIEDVIYSLESYDITTIRASVGMYLLSKYISNNTDVRVIYSGEGSDELTQGYIYFHKSPSPIDSHNESVRLLKNLYMYDVLRCDRATSAHGLEVRVPFLDKDFVNIFMSVPEDFRVPRKNIEKYLVRSLFNDDNLLPDQILWRPKEAFSDGVSGTKRSWHHIIQDHIDKLITDDEFKKQADKYSHNPPLSKEAYYYRKIFDKYYKGNDKLIAYYWMPKWIDVSDPSARALKHYKQKDSSENNDH